MADQDVVAVVVSEHRCDGCGQKITDEHPCLRTPALEVSVPISPGKFRNLARFPLDALKGDQMVFHDLTCLRMWAITNETMRDLFANWLLDERRFLFVVKGVREWYSVQQVEALFAQGVTLVHSAGRVREADGAERPFSIVETEWLDHLNSQSNILSA